MTAALGLLSIATPNLEDMRAFYCALLEVEPAVELEGGYLEFRLQGLRLGLYRSKNPDYRACRGASSICLQVTDLDAVLELAVLDGVQISQERVESHGREVDFCDPDGNRVVVHEPSATFWNLMRLSAP
ncbi:MAG: VOC family protein [Synechococcus sp.]